MWAPSGHCRSDIFERPLIDANEKTELAPNMIIVPPSSCAPAIRRRCLDRRDLPRHRARARAAPEEPRELVIL
jgi:hypothetical protein